MLIIIEMHLCHFFTISLKLLSPGNRTEQIYLRYKVKHLVQPSAEDTACKVVSKNYYYLKKGFMSFIVVSFISIWKLFMSNLCENFARD